MNKAILIGNVGRDPKVQAARDGSRFASFSLATSESWRDKATGERKERTDWHNVVVWGEGLVGVVEQFVRKGSKICVEGPVRTREYEVNGDRRWATEIVLQGASGRLELLGNAGNGGPPPPDSAPEGW